MNFTEMINYSISGLIILKKHRKDRFQDNGVAFYNPSQKKQLLNIMTYVIKHYQSIIPLIPQLNHYSSDFCHRHFFLTV